MKKVLAAISSILLLSLVSFATACNSASSPSVPSPFRLVVWSDTKIGLSDL
jgi:hypothetical protein